MTATLAVPTATEPGLAILTERTDLALTEFLDARSAELAQAGPELADLMALARRAVSGGKRLRPCFAYWGWRSVCGEPVPDDGLVTLAASLELLHACALVQDDVMDGSQLRRGRPATHCEFASLHRSQGWAGDAGDFGAAAATLLGDLLLAWAESMFASTGRLPGTRRVYEQMRQLVMAGQYLDILLHARGSFSTIDALRVATLKTGTYTVEGPLQLGAAAAGATPEALAVLRRYAVPLGEAFQLRDDVLGVYGDPERTGKPVGEDLREGKRTLLVALAMLGATPAQAALLRRSLGNPDPDLRAAGLAELRGVIRATGALEQVEARIAADCAAARAALLDADLDAVACSALDELAVRVTSRDR